MDLYNHVANQTATRVTTAYSTSFSLASRLFPRPMRQRIHDVYGLVRLADEIVDTYRGPGQRAILDDLEAETYAALERQYSSNLLVHAFARTAASTGIGRELIEPFFASMRQDITRTAYDQAGLAAYVYGSAEVVGLMCLRVFTGGHTGQYEQLRPGAQALGAAFQKVNFLRDLAADHDQLGRTYFPEVRWEAFDDAAKHAIEQNIQADFEAARVAIDQLPPAARPAVLAAYRYYRALFERIRSLSAARLQHGRVRLPNAHKIIILGHTAVAVRLQALAPRKRS